jgi:ABC-type multidrug transport system ATPase subunit
MLRLGDLVYEEKLKLVERVIDYLHLTKAKNTLIGGPLKRGISGGERKRVNIGNELLTQPSIILLDEPTSGLDTSTGIHLMQLLKGLSSAGLTVITTIHQPSPQMFSLFDDLLLLIDGNVSYYGPSTEAMPYFTSIGFNCSQFFNPADFMMGIILEEELKNIEGKTLKTKLIEDWKKKEKEKNEMEMEEEEKRVLEEYQALQEKYGTPSYTISFSEQVKVLLSRSFFQTKKVVFNIDDFVEIIIIALFVAILWWQQQNTLSLYNERLGVIYFIVIIAGLFFPAWKALLTFPAERAVILRERNSGSYRLSAYFIAKCLNEIPFLWEIPVLLVVISYFAVGLHLTPEAFFIFLFIILLSAWTAASMGLFISAVTGHNMNRGIVVMTIATIMIYINGGYYITHYPYWVQWINYLSYIKFSMDALLINEFHGTIWKVESVYGLPGNLNQINATEVSGDLILQNYPLLFDNIGLNVLVIFGYGVLFRILGLVGLQYYMRLPQKKQKKLTPK